ncbi:MAG: hypothetical protein WC404_00215 [Candidatus Omnitrophota bacterium]|jgi:hypothetical protein
MAAFLNDLSAKEIVELRLKCLEPIYLTASRHSMEKDEVIEFGEKAWTFAVKLLGKESKSKPA